MANSGNTRVCYKEWEKIEKCSLLKDEIARLWQMKEVHVIPIVVGVLGAITTKFEKYIEYLEIEIRIEHVQKLALLGAARIMRKVVSYEEPRKGYCCKTFDIWLMSTLTAKIRDTNISVLWTLNIIVIYYTNIGINVFKMIRKISESKTLIEHISCDRRCEFDGKKHKLKMGY